MFRVAQPIMVVHIFLNNQGGTIFICTLYLFDAIFVKATTNPKLKIDFLTRNRHEAISYFAPNFTPFIDMIDLSLRASEFGFSAHTRKSNRIPDAFIFRGVPLSQNRKTNITVEFSIPTYMKIVVELCKTVLNRGSPNNISEHLNLHDLLVKSLKPNGVFQLIDPNDMRIFRLTSRTHNSYAEDLFHEVFMLPLLPDYGVSKQSIPIGVLAMFGWRPFFWIAISESQNFYTTLPGKRIDISPITSTVPSLLDELSSTYIFYLCAILRKDKDILPRDIPAGFCPNPCSAMPCNSIPHTSGQDCELVGYGLHINDFQCGCKPGFKWVGSILDSREIEDDDYVKIPISDELGRCEQIDVCSTYCNLQGTRRCDILPGTATAICICKLTYMGPTCSSPRNPCFELSATENMPGNMACNSGQGGNCIPSLGSDHYECQCGNQLIKDIALDFPNCLALKDRCTSEICIRGDCISSQDGTEIFCVCPEEAYGERCELMRGAWAEWSGWSSYSPACGHGVLRRRQRVRGCLGEACQGGSGARQVELSPENAPCPDELFALSQGVSALRGHSAMESFARAPLEVQKAAALKKRRLKLLISILKLTLLALATFMAISATIIALFALIG